MSNEKQTVIKEISSIVTNTQKTEGHIIHGISSGKTAINYSSEMKEFLNISKETLETEAFCQAHGKVKELILLEAADKYKAQEAICVSCFEELKAKTNSNFQTASWEQVLSDNMGKLKMINNEKFSFDFLELNSKAQKCLNENIFSLTSELLNISNNFKVHISNKISDRNEQIQKLKSYVSELKLFSLQNFSLEEASKNQQLKLKSVKLASFLARNSDLDLDQLTIINGLTESFKAYVRQVLESKTKLQTKISNWLEFLNISISDFVCKSEKVSLDETFKTLINREIYKINTMNETANTVEHKFDINNFENRNNNTELLEKEEQITSLLIQLETIKANFDEIKESNQSLKNENIRLISFANEIKTNLEIQIENKNQQSIKNAIASNTEISLISALKASEKELENTNLKLLSIQNEYKGLKEQYEVLKDENYKLAMISQELISKHQISISASGMSSSKANFAAINEDISNELILANEKIKKLEVLVESMRQDNSKLAVFSQTIIEENEKLKNESRIISTTNFEDHGEGSFSYELEKIKLDYEKLLSQKNVEYNELLKLHLSEVQEYKIQFDNYKSDIENLINLNNVFLGLGSKKNFALEEVLFILSIFLFLTSFFLITY